jgi:hypothetical protein
MVADTPSSRGCWNSGAAIQNGWKEPTMADKAKKNEKYGSWPHFWVAYANREVLRARLKPLVSWKHHDKLDEGCTAVLGLCSKLPHVLAANLECLEACRWPELRELVIAIDNVKENVDTAYVEDILLRFRSLNVRFSFYSEKQHRMAEKLKLPYVYSWLSWVTAMNEVRTKTVLIHDYDALVLSDALGKRYKKYVESGVKMQGIVWYWVNGLCAEDKIASTFEAFVDLNWVKSFHPIRMFNKVSLLGGRRIDHDTLTDMQAKETKVEERDVVVMGLDDLVHPAQMIHQYMVALKHPGKAWFCASLIMIPFFNQLSGQKNALSEATARVHAANEKIVELLGDGCLMNFSFLQLSHLDRVLKQVVQVLVRKNVKPFKGVIEYGDAFYELIGVTPADRWVNGFDHTHRQWIFAAQASYLLSFPYSPAGRAATANPP